MHGLPDSRLRRKADMTILGLDGHESVLPAKIGRRYILVAARTGCLTL